MNATLFPDQRQKPDSPPLAMTTRELTNRLRRHYIKPGPMPGGVFLEEVGKNGAFGASRRCDALYVGFTSASGRLLIGHEIKVSRSDWLHELATIGKADDWADQCHEWWLVTPSADIVHDGELPAGWGHLIVNPKSRTRLYEHVKAKRSDHNPAWWAARSVMARLDTLQQDELHRIRASALSDARAELAKKEAEKKRPEISAEEIDALDQARLFERQTGEKLGAWSSATKVSGADLVRLARALPVLERLAMEKWSGMADISRQVSNALETIDEARDALKALVEGGQP